MKQGKKKKREKMKKLPKSNIGLKQSETSQEETYIIFN